MSDSSRLHGLDAVRALALLGGIVLHACMSFLPGFREVGWPISDRSSSVTLGVLFFVIHTFRMTTFFLIAGFFGRMMFHRKGARAFVGNRLLRIAVPLVFGWPLLFPPIVVAFIWGSSKLSGGTPPPPPPSGGSLSFPLTHLWFLYVLLWLYTVVLVARAVFVRIIDRSGGLRQKLDRCVQALLRSGLASLVLAAPLCASLYFHEGWVMWFGIPTPDQSLIPNVPAFVGFATAFSLGWLVQRQPDLLQAWERQWLIHLAMAVVLTVAALALAGVVPTYTPTEPGTTKLTYAVCYTIAVWSWTFAVIGMGLRFCSEPNPSLRYLADSSYWLYLIHLPIIFLAQVLVMEWELHWSVKFVLILGTTLPLMLLSYHYLVRSTFIGGVLNGRRYARVPQTVPRAEPTG
ncbi:MAG: acyltransferase family protein [Planctomycetota bacterium]